MIPTTLTVIAVDGEKTGLFGAFMLAVELAVMQASLIGRSRHNSYVTLPLRNSDRLLSQQRIILPSIIVLHPPPRSLMWRLMTVAFESAPRFLQPDTWSAICKNDHNEKAASPSLTMGIVKTHGKSFLTLNGSKVETVFLVKRYLPPLS